MQKIEQYRDAIKLCFASDGHPRTMKEIISWVDLHFLGQDWSESTFTAQVYKSCANVEAAYKSKAPKIIFYTRSDRSYRLATDTKIDHYCLQFDDLSNSFTEHETSPETKQPVSAENTFALEAHLQRYLVRNLTILEQGLQIWDGSRPIEYTISGNRIDILAKDTQGVPVIVELKVLRGHYKVAGQVLYYRGLVKSTLMCHEFAS